MKNRRKRGFGRFAGALVLGFLAMNLSLPVQTESVLWNGWAGISPQIAWAAEEKTTITYEGPVFTEENESVRPKETLEQGGRQYRLVSSRIRSAVKEGTLTYASASVSYDLEGKDEPPETAMITLKDDVTGKEYEREVPRQEIQQKGTVWTDDFRFPVTVSGYDAETFYLGETEIPSDADLSAYGEEFLRYLGLPEDCYRVDEVVWSGESYEEDGMLCRNAEARGAKLIRNVEVKYGGQVRTPEIRGKQYIGVYEEIIPETETEETTETEPEIKTTQPEEPETQPAEPAPAPMKPMEKLMYWIKEHLTVVTIGAGFFLALALAAVLFWLSRKKSGGDS